MADLVAKSIHTGNPLGERAEWGRDRPRASPTTWEVAAVQELASATWRCTGPSKEFPPPVP